MEKNPHAIKSRYNKHILSFPWPFVISKFHWNIHTVSLQLTDFGDLVANCMICFSVLAATCSTSLCCLWFVFCKFLNPYCEQFVNPSTHEASGKNRTENYPRKYS